MRRNPRKDPIPGDVIEFRVTPKAELWGWFRVQRIGDDGTVFYWDEGLIDYVPLKRWREWFVGRRDVRVTPNAGGKRLTNRVAVWQSALNELLCQKTTWITTCTPLP